MPVSKENTPHTNYPTSCVASLCCCKLSLVDGGFLTEGPSVLRRPAQRKLDKLPAEHSKPLRGEGRQLQPGVC